MHILEFGYFLSIGLSIMVIVYEDVWKEVYLAGTEWNQFADVDKYDWDFEHLDDALNDGALAKGSVYLFGSTERT